MAYIKTTNGQIYYEYELKDESYETLVLAHGTGLDHTTWQYLTPYLESYNILMFDFKGHGFSSSLEKTVDWDVFQKDYVQLLLELNIKEYHLIGHGLGFQFILEYITKFNSNNIKSITSLSTPSLYPINIAKKGVQLRKTVAEGYGFDFLVDQLIKQFVHKQTNHQITLLKESFNRLDQNIYFPLMDLQVESFNNEKLLNVKVPVLFLSGELDKNYPPQLNMVSTNYFTKSKYYVVPDSSNMVHLDQPKHTAYLINKFIKEQSEGNLGDEYSPEFLDELNQSLQSVVYEGMEKINRLSKLQVNFLNGFSVTYNGEKLKGKWNQRKAKNILAYIVINKTVTREKLCDLFWSDRPVTNGLKNVRVSINHLRNIFIENNLSIDDYFEIETEKISLKDDIECDVEQLIKRLNFIEKEQKLELKIQKYQHVINDIKFPLFEELYDDWLMNIRESTENRLKYIMQFILENTANKELATEYKHLLNQLDIDENPV